MSGPYRSDPRACPAGCPWCTRIAKHADEADVRALEMRIAIDHVHTQATLAALAFSVATVFVLAVCAAAVGAA